METEARKLVFAPWGADMFGDDVLLFEHGLLFALETAVETASGFVYADVHDQLGGADKRERPVPAFTDGELRRLAARAQCEAVVDGMLSVERDPQTGSLVQIAAAPRLFFPREDRVAAPDGFAFHAFDPEGKPETLALDYDLYIALQYRLCEGVLDALGVALPPAFTTERLQITPSGTAYLAFLKGKRLANSAETKLGYYEQALQADPNFFLALYNSAMLYKTQTDYHAMRNRLLRAAPLTNDPQELGDVYFELGLSSIFLGDPKTARNFWEKALEYADENPTLYVNMAGTYEQEEDLPSAIRLYEEALTRFPDHHKAIVNLGRLNAMRGDVDTAIQLYERALELEPDDALRQSVLGGLYLAAERPEDARHAFTRAVALDPTGDPGQYARQELQKLGPPPGEDDTEGRKKKRWGLF